MPSVELQLSYDELDKLAKGSLGPDPDYAPELEEYVIWLQAQRAFCKWLLDHSEVIY